MPDWILFGAWLLWLLSLPTAYSVATGLRDLRELRNDPAGAVCLVLGVLGLTFVIPYTVMIYLDQHGW